MDEAQTGLEERDLKHEATLMSEPSLKSLENYFSWKLFLLKNISHLQAQCTTSVKIFYSVKEDMEKCLKVMQSLARREFSL